MSGGVRAREMGNEGDEDSPVFTSLGLPQQVLQSLRVVRSESTGSQRSLGGLLGSGDLLSGSDLGGGGVVLELQASYGEVHVRCQLVYTSQDLLMMGG